MMLTHIYSDLPVLPLPLPCDKHHHRQNHRDQHPDDGYDGYWPHVDGYRGGVTGSRLLCSRNVAGGRCVSVGSDLQWGITREGEVVAIISFPFKKRVHLWTMAA